MALNDKQRRFVAEYLIDLNATQAAIRAGYSEKTAGPVASRLLTYAKIQAAIADGQGAREKRTQITQDRVLQEMARIGFSDVRQIFDDNGHLIDVTEWPDTVAPAVSGIEFVTNEPRGGPVEHVAKVKLWDKGRALENLAKHLGMLRPDVNVDLRGLQVSWLPPEKS